jgi:hypothetical protein
MVVGVTFCADLGVHCPAARNVCVRLGLLLHSVAVIAFGKDTKKVYRNRNSI